MILNPQLAEQARTKLQVIIDSGKKKAENNLKSIIEEYDVRKDFLVPATTINYQDISKQQVGIKDKEFHLTNYSLSQLLSKVGMPKTFFTTLQNKQTSWANNLIKANLESLTINGAMKGKKLLFRTIDDLAKGILSDSYRRMDARPIFDTFINQGLKKGLVPMDGLNTTTQYHVKMVLPEIYEPIEGEVIAFGFCMTTSDYGAAALQMQSFIMRIHCTNLAIGEDIVRKVHLGRRINDNDLTFSQQTYDLDTKTIASMVGDFLSENAIQEQLDSTLKAITNSSEREIDIEATLKSLREKGIITKDGEKTAKMLYDTDAIELLPSQKGAWKFSNVLGLMANKKDIDGDISLKLQEAAYSVINQ